MSAMGIFGASFHHLIAVILFPLLIFFHPNIFVIQELQVSQKITGH